MGSGGSKTLWSSGKYCFLVFIFILNLALAMFYFHMGNPHYHRRCFVSLLSSAWGQVGPKRYSHQEIWVQMSNDIVPRTSIPFAQGEPISRYR